MVEKLKRFTPRKGSDYNVVFLYWLDGNNGVHLINLSLFFFDLIGFDNKVFYLLLWNVGKFCDLYFSIYYLKGSQKLNII